MKWLKNQITFLQVSHIISIKEVQILVGDGREVILKWKCAREKYKSRAVSHQSHFRGREGREGRWIQEWKGNGNPDRRVWQPIMHVLPKSWMWLCHSACTHVHTHAKQECIVTVLNVSAVWPWRVFLMRWILLNNRFGPSLSLLSVS